MKGLKQTRINRGLSRQNIANATGITYANLSQIERGVQTPTLLTRKRLELILNEKINWLDTPNFLTDCEILQADWNSCEREFRYLFKMLKSLSDIERQAFILSAMKHLRKLI